MWIMIMFLVFCGVGYSQTQSSQSGEPEYITNEILRLESIRISDHEAFVTGLEKLTSEKHKMSAYQLCHMKFLQAYQVAFQGDTQQAISDVEDLVPLCEDLRARIRMDAVLANLSALSGDYSKASKFIDNTIKNVEQTSDIKSKAIAYTAASMVYNLLDQKELSVKYSEILYRLVPSAENKCRLEYTRNVYHLDGNQVEELVDAVDYTNNACIESGNDLIAQSILLDSIKRRLASDEIDEASMKEMSQWLVELRPEIATGPYKNTEAQFSAIEAKFADLRGDLAAAKKHGEETLVKNEGLGNTEQLIMALEVLELIAMEEQDFIKAYQYLDRKNDVELGLYDQSQAKQMAFMTVKHTNLSKVFEIEQLNRQKEVLELEKELAKQETNNQRLVILLILTLLGFMALWLLRIKKKHDYFKGVSEIDHLTKVLTRKAFEEQIKVQLNHCQDHKLPIQVAIMDLDHFKNVNDTHGHLIGDWVLKNVMYAIKEYVEEGIILARLGGEEFCIVFPKVECDVMAAKLEMMRSAIESLDCTESGAELSVTASFGYTSSKTSGYSLPLLLTHADVALFDAKRNGRNQVVKFKTIQSKKQS